MRAETADTTEAWVERTVAALAAIQEHAGGRWGIEGVLPCPCCREPLSFTIAAVNGRVQARCETAGCVSFIQYRSPGSLPGSLAG